MPIFFNSLLKESSLSLKDVRLLRHRDTRSDKGRTPFELWRDDPKNFDLYQSIQKPGRREQLRTKYWASFVGLPDGRTLFVGLFRVEYSGLSTKDTPKVHTSGIDRAGTHDTYKLAMDGKLAEFAGRLYVSWGAGKRSWVQRPDKRNKLVTELLTAIREPEFPGFLKFISNLSKIQGEALPSGWKDILKISRGVYLLTCPKTKEQYVGSAKGQTGFWGRWKEHAKTGYGDAVKLKSRARSDYQVSIMEVVGTSTTDDEIGELENRWKEKLRTREMGLNGN
jgi:hypothetical protein